MNRVDVLVDREQMYALTRDDLGQLYIEVVIGGFAMETFVMKLEAEELSQYENEGAAFLAELALRIAKTTPRYTPRRIV